MTLCRHDRWPEICRCRCSGLETRQWGKLNNYLVTTATTATAQPRTSVKSCYWLILRRVHQSNPFKILWCCLAAEVYTRLSKVVWSFYNSQFFLSKEKFVSCDRHHSTPHMTDSRQIPCKIFSRREDMDTNINTPHNILLLPSGVLRVDSSGWNNAKYADDNWKLDIWKDVCHIFHQSVCKYFPS